METAINRRRVYPMGQHHQVDVFDLKLLTDIGEVHNGLGDPVMFGDREAIAITSTFIIVKPP